MATFLQFAEQLDDCKKYKDFLIKLTPKEWFEEQLQMKAREQEKARQLLLSSEDHFRIGIEKSLGMLLKGSSFQLTGVC